MEMFHISQNPRNGPSPPDSVNWQSQEICVSVCAWGCACKREKERERKRERKKNGERERREREREKMLENDISVLINTMCKKIPYRLAVLSWILKGHIHTIGFCILGWNP